MAMEFQAIKHAEKVVEELLQLLPAGAKEQVRPSPTRHATC